MSEPLDVVMIGSSGAVGGHVARTLADHPQVRRLTLLGRRETDIEGENITQHVVDLMSPVSYATLLSEHQVAICTLGVGEPSKMDKETFVRIDHDVVLDFARQCEGAGVSHFSLLSSVGVSASSRSFYLRTKGELEDSLRALGFDRLSLFHPSMILTPTNRYGFAQAATLKLWPVLSPLLGGPARKYRGVLVDVLGRAMAQNIFVQERGEETLEWSDFESLTQGT